MQSGLLHRSHSTPFHYFHLNHPWPSTFYLQSYPLSCCLPAFCIKFPRRTPDSGADGSQTRRFSRWRAKKRNRGRWSDDSTSEQDESAPGLWEEFIDNMWFLKVLGSYGWTLPIIMISWVVATGPKAFLTSFSIPFGVSVLMYVFKKLLAWIQSNTGYKPRSENIITEEEEEEEFQWNNSKQRTRVESYSAETVDSNGVPSFGGWEDLIDERELKARRAQRRRRTMNQTSIPLEKRMRELKTTVEGERDLPLLLKILVAVFPFLSSWTELL